MIQVKTTFRIVGTLSGALLAASCGHSPAQSTVYAAPNSTPTAVQASPSATPSTVWDDRLAGIDTAVVNSRLTRSITLTADTTMGVPTTVPVTPQSSVLNDLVKGEGVFPSVDGLQPQLVFCALTSNTGGTINADNSVTPKYVKRPVWAVVYHDIQEHANANSIPPVGPTRGPIDAGPLVDANVVAFVDDLTGQFLFATDDSIRRAAS